MRAALLLPLGLATGAAGQPMPAVALHQTQRVGHLLVTPLSVVRDRRCPADIMCVRTGPVVVRVEIRDGRRRYRRLISTSPPRSYPVQVEAVTPERTSGRLLEPGDYRFRFALAPAGVTR